MAAIIAAQRSARAAAALKTDAPVVGAAEAAAAAEAAEAAAAAAEAAEAALDVEAAAEATKVRRDSQYRGASTPSWFKRLTGESVG